MKKYPLPLIVLLVILLVSACSSSASSVDTATSQPVGTVGIPQTGSDHGKQVTITLKDNTIESSRTIFQVGVPYTFVITNSGNFGHNFNINAPVAITGSLDASLSSALLVVERNKLNPGESLTVDFTFPASVAGQSLEFSCLTKRQYEEGMKLVITVTK